jgi:hypothetical protein
MNPRTGSSASGPGIRGCGPELTTQVHRQGIAKGRCSAPKQNYHELTTSGEPVYRAAMGALTIELPLRQTQTEFHLRRWAGLLADPELD